MEAAGSALASGVPPAIVDCHAHIFDPVRYPFHASGTYDLAPNEIGDATQYLAVLDAHGVDHAVLINPLGGYGLNNDCMLEAIAASGGRLKGVAVVATDIAESAAARLHAAGVEGIRFSLHHPTGPSLADGNGDRILALAHEIGWKVLIHYTGDLLVEVLPWLKRSRAAFVIDHCGRPVLANGIRQPGFQSLLELGRSSDAVIKLSGVFRFTTEPWPHRDVEPYVQALVEAFGADRCIWGSDWPFTRMDRRVDYGPLLALVARWFPDESQRRKVLGTNAAALFRFT